MAFDFDTESLHKNDRSGRIKRSTLSKLFVNTIKDNHQKVKQFRIYLMIVVINEKTKMIYMYMCMYIGSAFGKTRKKKELVKKCVRMQILFAGK